MTLLTPKSRGRAKISELVGQFDPEVLNTSNEIALLYDQVFINGATGGFIMQNNSTQLDVTNETDVANEINSKLSFVENAWSIEGSLRHCNIAIKELGDDFSTFPVLQDLLYTQKMLSESIEKLEVPRCLKNKLTVSLDIYSNLPLDTLRHVSLMNKSIETINI